MIGSFKYLLDSNKWRKVNQFGLTNLLTLLDLKYFFKIINKIYFNNNKNKIINYHNLSLKLIYIRPIKNLSLFINNRLLYNKYNIVIKNNKISQLFIKIISLFHIKNLYKDIIKSNKIHKLIEIITLIILPVLRNNKQTNTYIILKLIQIIIVIFITNSKFHLWIKLNSLIKRIYIIIM